MIMDNEEKQLNIKAIDNRMKQVKARYELGLVTEKDYKYLMHRAERAKKAIKKEDTNEI